MRTGILFLIATFGFGWLNSTKAQNRTDNFTLTETIDLGGDPFIYLNNINGDITVTGYEGDEVQITYERTLKVKGSQNELTDQEAAEFMVKSTWYEGNLFIYVDGPGISQKFAEDGMNYNINWDNVDIKFSFEMKVKVPIDVYVEASTINGGNLVVQKLTNGVHAANINGNVLLQDIVGQTSAQTVNGDIEVWFAESPITDTDFKTVNGTIEIHSPKDLGAVVTFESLHGELYTNFDEVSYLPNRLNKQDDGDARRYLIKNTAPIQIGAGGPAINLTMVNGNAYIKQRES